jgi:hypothetical protein
MLVRPDADGAALPTMFLAHRSQMLRIRMYSRDMLDLYPRAQIGAKVAVTWRARFDAE